MSDDVLDRFGLFDGIRKVMERARAARAQFFETWAEVSETGRQLMSFAEGIVLSLSEFASPGMIMACLA